jgi:hypothetical protein
MIARISAVAGPAAKNTAMAAAVIARFINCTPRARPAQDSPGPRQQQIYCAQACNNPAALTHRNGTNCSDGHK